MTTYKISKTRSSMLTTKRYLIILIFIFLSSVLYCAPTTVTVYTTGFDSQNLEAESVLNPVLHLKINAAISDTFNSIAVKNTIDSWGYGSAKEPGSIAPGSIKVWYVPVDSPVFNPASAQYVTTLAAAGSGNNWNNTISSGFTVADGSALWITVDFTSYPDFGVVQFQTDGLDFTTSPGISFNEPIMPSVLLVRQCTAAKNLEISNSSGSMQPEVSTDQGTIIATKLSFFNNSSSISAPAMINSISFTVVDSLSTVLDPLQIIAGIRIQDADSGTTYGELLAPFTVAGDLSFKVPVSIDVPPSSTITANVIIKIISAPLTDNTNFAIGVLGPAAFDAVDSYTFNKVSVYAAPLFSFPLNSTYATIKKKAVQTNLTYDGSVIPSNISNGQINVPLALLKFVNPGDTASAYEEVYSVKITIKDVGGNAIIPRDLFSKISIVNASGAAVTYGQKIGTAIENTGDTITIPLPYPIPVQPSGSPAYVSIKADINPSSIYNNFKVSIESLSHIQSRDRNSFAYIPVVSIAPAPLTNGFAILPSSFKTSAAPLMPSNIYKGQISIPVMNLTFSSPLIFGGGNILIKGITLTVKDAGGTNQDISGLFSAFNVESSHWSGSYTQMPATPSSTIYLAFPDSITLSASNTSETISIKVSLNNNVSAQYIQLLLNSSADITCSQDNEPGRDINPSRGSVFPFSSGSALVSSESSDTAFTNYPNPFRKGGLTKLAYYLTENSVVTIDIFDITGSLIKEIISKENKSTGSHEESTWDGTDKSGRSVIAGTYMATITVKNTTGTKKYSRKLTFIK